ncbi:PREDICTED: solute carrier family 35 member F1-like [Ipomoea nil]|uniref:solute carrier family 35 member F1-like n=1 Tax=Ipomoea nil TaxID=35883 RepID=UPI000901B8DC|nr:PREDICTED: solute carrier family 35 member F1-like [Ipomoea nil]
MNVNGWWGTHGNDIGRTLYLLFLGQVISFVMSLMSFTSSLLASLGVDTPLTLSFFIYLALTLVYGSIFIYRRQKLQVPWYWYLLIGFADVQGNFLVNQAFQYSSITSVTILDCWTIAWVILLTWYFLGTRYSLWQFFGAAVCVAGLGLVLLSDAGVGGGGGSRPLLGDTFVIMGTLFFALSNVGEEICVKKKDRVEVITMMAISGLLVSICEIAILETKGLASVKWSPEIILAFAGFAFAGFLFYTFVPILLKMSGATLFNLSLLTSDMWAVVIRIFFYQQEVDWLYYVAFGLVGIGLVVYSKTEKVLDSAPETGDGSQYQILDEECRDARNDDVGDRS